MTWKYLGYEITPELIYLIEALKVEGYWSVKNRECSIQNKNIPFLRRIENLLQNLDIKPSKRICVKIKLPSDNIDKEDIVLMIKNRKFPFRIEKSPFDGSKKVAFMIPYSKNIRIRLSIEGKQFIINIKQICDEFQINSELKAFAYLEIRFWDPGFIKFLDKYTIGNKSRELRVEGTLFRLSEKYVANALSALIDSEGSIDFYAHTRRIRIRMNNLLYLQDWKKILNKYGIYSHLGSDKKLNNLVITGWEDFNRVSGLGLELHHSKKRSKWSSILNSYKKKQISRDTSHEFYVNELKRIGKPISASDLANQLDKSKRAVNHYLTKLHRKDLIRVDRSRVRYLYSAKQ